MLVRWRPFLGLGLIGVLALAGCGKSYQDYLKAPEERRPYLGGGPLAGGVKKLVPVKAEYDGMLTGRVVFEGTPPPKVKIPDLKPECLAAEANPKFKDDVYNLDWIVGEGQGVKNVVIFLKAPDGTFFAPTEDDWKAVDPEAYVDQPYCAFHPQVVLHFPAFYKEDGTLEPTGQKPVIYNKGDITHNADLFDADARAKTPTFNETIAPGKKKEGFVLNPQRTPLGLRCSIHPWMRARIWVFDHPYAVKTDEKGEFTLKNVPTGVDLQVVYWHPAKGFFGEGGQVGKTMRFNAGANEPLNITISP